MHSANLQTFGSGNCLVQFFADWKNLPESPPVQSVRLHHCFMCCVMLLCVGSAHTPLSNVGCAPPIDQKHGLNFHQLGAQTNKLCSKNGRIIGGEVPLGGNNFYNFSPLEFDSGVRHVSPTN